MAARKARALSWRSETTPEKLGTSLFHQLLNKRMLLNARDDQKSLLHRLIFVSKISPDLADKRNLGEYWEQQFQRYNQGENVTGLLLLYPAYAIHCLESSGDVLYCIIRDLQRLKKQGDRALVLDLKIVVMSHNIPSRLFNQWNYKVLDVPGQYLGDKFTDEAMDRIISECLTKILKIGKHLMKYPKAYSSRLHMHTGQCYELNVCVPNAAEELAELQKNKIQEEAWRSTICTELRGSKNIPDSVFEKIPELIIPQTTILHLLQCKDLLTPEQFLQLYDNPLHIMLDSDRVWPTRVHLAPVKTRSLH